MRRIVFILSIALMAVSCFDMGSKSEQSYTLVASFEYTGMNYVEKFGADSLFFDTTNGGLGIGFHNLAFYHKLNAGKTDVLGGFLASYLCPERAEEGGDNANRAYVMDPKKGSNTYLVYRFNPVASDMPEHDVEFMDKKYGTCGMVGCFVTNTVEVADSVAANFELGDRLTLYAAGYLNGQQTAQAELLLADFSAQKDSIVSTWTPFDLNKLGSVEYIEFSMVSSKPDVPLNFCLDDMVAAINLSYGQ